MKRGYVEHSGSERPQTGSSNKRLLPPPKQRAGRKRRPHGYPKRPLSAYNLFFQERRAHASKALAATGDARADFGSITKVVGKLWKELPQSERVPYQRQAQQKMEEYKAAVAEYEGAIRKEQADKKRATESASKPKACQGLPEAERFPKEASLPPFQVGETSSGIQLPASLPNVSFLLPTQEPTSTISHLRSPPTVGIEHLLLERQMLIQRQLEQDAYTQLVATSLSSTLVAETTLRRLYGQETLPQQPVADLSCQSSSLSFGHYSNPNTNSAPVQFLRQSDPRRDTLENILALQAAVNEDLKGNDRPLGPSAKDG